MSKKKEILKQMSIYSSATVLAQVITVCTAILTRYFLGPLQMGVWSILQVVLNYSKYSTLGTTSAASREIPFNHGKGDAERAHEIKNNVFSFTLLTSLFVSVGIFLYAFLRRGQLSEEIFYGLLFLSGLVILQRLNNIFIAFLRAYKEFKLASSQMIFSSMVNAVLVAILTYQFKIYGFMAALCLSLIFNIAYISYFHTFNFVWKIDIKKIKPLVTYGFPLMILGFVHLIVLSIDRIMIAKMIGLEALGLYSIAIMMFNYIAHIPTSIGIVLVPNLNEAYGKRENRRDLAAYLLKSTKGLSVMLPILIGFGWFVMPHLIQFVLPKYVEGILAMKFLILGAFFLALSDPYEQFLITIKKHLTLLKYVVLVCLLAILLNFVAVSEGYGIAGVAIATASAIFFRFVTVFMISSRYLFSVSEALKAFLLIFLKFTMMMFGLVILDRLFSNPALQYGLFVFLYAPAIFKLNREFGLFSLMKEKFLKKSYA